MRCTPLLTQVRPTYFSVNCGMTYLIRLSDGCFALIDSGYGEYDESDHLYGLLCAQNVINGVPTVAAWFFTHPHDDHVHGFIDFQKKYGDKVLVEAVYYDFPTYEVSNKGCNMQRFLDAIEQSGAKNVTPKRGDVIRLAAERFDVLYTASDWKETIGNVNEVSLVIKMHLGNYTVLSTGDLMQKSAEVLLSLCSPEVLKCDILQMPHHGYWGGSNAFFEAVDPEIVLWSVAEYNYRDMLAIEHNRYFRRTDTRVRHIFVSGMEENTFDMTSPIAVTIPYTPKKIIADFQKESIYALGWACLDPAGPKVYSPADLAFADGGCTLRTHNRPTLLQLIQNGQVATSQGYRFEITLVPQSACETLGLVYDCARPTDPNGYAYYPLPHTAGEELTVSLTVDRTANTAEIAVHQSTETLPLRTAVPCDILLVIERGEIAVSKAVFENL